MKNFGIKQAVLLIGLMSYIKNIDLIVILFENCLNLNKC